MKGNIRHQIWKGECYHRVQVFLGWVQQQGRVSSSTKLSGDIRQSNLKSRVSIIIKDRGESSDNQVKEERMDIIEDERLDQ